MDYGQDPVLDDEDDEEEDTYTLPTKRFESDFRHEHDDYSPNEFKLWQPSREDYDQYERLLWQKEFRKLIEMDDNSMNNNNNNNNTKVPKGDRELNKNNSSSNKRESWPSLDLSDSDNMEEDEVDESDESMENEEGDEKELDSDYDNNDDNGIDMERGTRTTIEHPLLIPEVIEHILSFLDYHHDKETLENCQQVCLIWNQVVTDKLEQLESEESFKISHILKLGDMTIEDEVLKAVVPRKCHWFNIKLPPKKPLLVENVFKNIGRQMRELDVCFKIKDKPKDSNQIQMQQQVEEQNHHHHQQHQQQPQEEQNTNNNAYNIDTTNLGDYIENYCPHLEKLKLWLSTPSDGRHYPQSIFSSKEKNHFFPLKQLEMEDDDNEEDSGKTHIFEEIITASPLLEHLSFQHERTSLIVDVLKIIAKDKSRLKHFTSLECEHSDISEEFITFFLTHKWYLHHLKIGFKKEVSIIKIRALLNHLKDTLTSLVLLYKGPEYDPSLPIEDNWVVPLSMKNLKTFEISPDIFSNACRFFVNALQLQNLKSLKFTSTISWSENYFEHMWCRNRINRVREPSLRIFEIPASILDASIFLQEPNPFKNVKELVLDSPSIKVLQAIFLSLMNLERLKIFELYSLSNYTWDHIMTGYFDDLYGRPILWDEVFTGKKRPVYTIQYRMQAEPLLEGAENVPSIRNLTKLKSLMLDFKSSHQKISDFFIYHGLFDLKELQHIDINRHSFTEEAVSELKKQVFQFCHFELGVDSGDSESDF